LQGQYYEWREINNVFEIMMPHIVVSLQWIRSIYTLIPWQEVPLVVSWAVFCLGNEKNSRNLLIEMDPHVCLDFDLLTKGVEKEYGHYSTRYNQDVGVNF
jgi:hypothetical protein